jgi:hypothetical protein
MFLPAFIPFELPDPAVTEAAGYNLRLGWRAVHPDFRSRDGYRYPFPGQWADAGGPILNHTDACPRAAGDGLWAARDARAASAAWEISWVTIIAVGATEMNDSVTTRTWSPLLDAFEAGAFAMWIDAATIYVAARPDRVIVGPNNRLHCETGPAFSWLGVDDYYWNGVMVPAHWITDRDNLDPREVIKAENDEQRAAGAEICGWPKMLSVLKAKTIHDSGSEDMGSLIELKLPSRSSFLMPSLSMMRWLQSGTCCARCLNAAMPFCGMWR